MSSPASSSPKVHPVLWTSGWDSTFRVLDVLFSTQDIVQPYYLYSLARKSNHIELRTIHNIMRRLAKEHPEKAARIRSPIMRLGDQYRYGGTYIEAAMNKIREKMHMGMQYLYLAVFRDTEDVTGLQMGVVKGEGAVFNLVRTWLIKDEEGMIKLSDDAPEEVRAIFGGYHFPLAETTKLDMPHIAEEKGFRDLLEMSWFCHKPIDFKPCGLCRPCMVTIKSGLGHRVGEPGLTRHREAMEAASTPDLAADVPTNPEG